MDENTKKKKGEDNNCAKNYICRMYNHFRRCLIVSKIYWDLLTQKSYESILSPKFDCNIRRIWNDTMCKRFYCQIVTDKKTKALQDDAQQKLDELLSHPEYKKRYQLLELEISAMYYGAQKVPTKLRSSDWWLLLKLPSRRQKIKYLYYLWCNETAKKIKKNKKVKWRAEKAKAKQIDTDEIRYRVPHNSMFMHVYQRTMNQYYNAKLIQAMMFAPKVVFDCSYESYMNYHEIHNCARQLTLAFADNRAHVDPMCLYFCNLNKDGMLMEYFHRNIPILLDPEFPAIVTSQSYLNLFPKDQLLYLTPHCKTDITEYDPDTIYIIGAMVDKANSAPISLAKAKKNGIRMGKLPIESYLKWNSGSKCFTLDQMINILLDIKYTRDWNKAFQHVPNRKLKESKKEEKSKDINCKRNLHSEKMKNKKSSMIDQFNFALKSRKQS